jgi:hypothetical protein
MQSAPKIFIAFLIAALLTACASNETKSTSANQTNQAVNSANSNSVKYDDEELEMTINLPFHPEEAMWREEPSRTASDNRAPNDKKLVAVLRFLKADADKIVAQAEKYKPAAPETISTESWFPGELIAQSQMSGDETIKGLTYAANDFYNAPFTDGKITRIEGTDYFVLELFAK